MLHLFQGTDDYSAAQAAHALAREATGGDETFILRYEGSSTPWPAIQEACYTVSMFAPAQVVLVQGLLGAWGGRGEGAVKSQHRPSAEDFAAMVKGLPAATQLILLEGVLTEANRYARELGKLGQEHVHVQVFLAPDGPDLHRRLATMVRERGGSIDPAAAQELVQRCGADLRRLSQEVDKLLIHAAPGRNITVDAVAALIVAGEDATAFALVDAIVARQAARAVQLVERLLAADEAPEGLLALLGGRIRECVLLASAEQEGIADQSVADKVGWKSWRLRQIQQARRQFTLAQLREVQALLVAVDAALKSRPTHERSTLLLVAILTITQRRGMVELESVLAG